MNIQAQQERLLALGIPTEISKYGDLTPIGRINTEILEDHGFMMVHTADDTIVTFETYTERCNIIACHPAKIEIFSITPEEVSI